MTRRSKQKIEEPTKITPKFDFMVKYQWQKVEYDKATWLPTSTLEN